METFHKLYLTINYYMLRPRQLLSLTLIILFLSCKNNHDYTYAIKDFRKSLQPYLIKIVSRGVVMYYDSSLRHMATDKELIELCQSEHPVLRASAFREMLKRESFNHFDILMNHLDDTAIVQTDGGEFGIWYRTVSDDILQEARWKTDNEKSKTIEQVFTKHNYLRSAYTILLQIEPQEKYYAYIKDMAIRPRRLSNDGYELNFYDIEYALYGLAKFKKMDDIKIIKKQLTDNVWRLSSVSFRLMKEFPDTAYLDILEDYHSRRFYRFSGDDKDGFTGNDDNRASSDDFIEAVMSQKNEKSARILDTLLTRLPLLKCNPNKAYLEDNIVRQIWGNPHPAYKKLKDKIKDKAKEIFKNQLSMPMEQYDFPIDTTKENIRW